MIAQNIASDLVSPLKLTDSGRKALKRMEKYRISHLPVVENERLLGVISDRIIYDLNILDQPIEAYSPHLLTPHVHLSQHIYEVFAAISVLHLSAIPVLDAQHVYSGLITVFDLSQKFAELVAVSEKGGIIVLELNSIDYSLSQIAQIVESNDARILSFYIHQEKESKMMIVTLKLNILELSSVIQTFMRFNYNILTVYTDESSIRNLYDDRYDQLMKYMNV